MRVILTSRPYCGFLTGGGEDCRYYLGRCSPLGPKSIAAMLLALTDNYGRLSIDETDSVRVEVYQSFVALCKLL